MTQKEFEERTNIDLAKVDFGMIHDIYMACGDNMDKDEFCALWNAGKFRELLYRVTNEKNITEQAYDMAMNEIQKMKDEKELHKMESVEFLLGKADVYKDTDFYREAVGLVGKKEVILTKMRMGLPLWEEDIEYINNNLK